MKNRRVPNRRGALARIGVAICTAATMAACTGANDPGAGSAPTISTPTDDSQPDGPEPSVPAGESSIPATSATPIEPPAGPAGGGGDLRFGFLVGFSTMDPHRFAGSQHLTAMWSIYEGLTGLDDNNVLVPRAAESWVVSDDGTAVEFTLRSGMSFHDGTPVDAAAVVANLDRARAADSIGAESLSSIASVTAEGSGTVIVELSEPDSTLLATLATDALLVSPAVIEGSIDEAPVGSGPFKVDAWTAGGSTLELSRFEGYWEPGVPKLDRLTIEVIEDVQTRATAQTTGELDLQLITPGSGFLAPQLESAGLSVESRQQGIVWFIGLNTSRPPFDDIRVREAINRSFDRDLLSEALGFGFGQPAYQYLPDDDPAAATSVDPAAYGYDPTRAMELLTEAGYPDGLTVKLATFPFFQTVAEAVAQQLETSGFDVEVSTIDDPTQYASAGEGDAFLNVSSDLFDGLRSMRDNFSQRSFLAPVNAQLPELGAAFDAALGVPTAEEAAPLAQAVSEQLVEQYFFVPLFRPGLQAVRSEGVEGYVIPFSAQSQFRNVRLT